MKLSLLRPAAFALASLLITGCGTMDRAPRGLTSPEQAARTFNVDGLRIGDGIEKIARFSQVVLRPARVRGYDEVYEIYNPNPQISAMYAFLRNGKIVRLELRYFDGRDVNTLSRAGGWAFLRDYLIERFGPPSQVGATVALETLQPGLDARYAKFNGVWIFNRIRRQVNYIAMSDNKGGVAVVTVQDTTPAPTPPPLEAPSRGGRTTARGARATETVTVVEAAPSQPLRPNPGF